MFSSSLFYVEAFVPELFIIAFLSLPILALALWLWRGRSLMAFLLTWGEQKGAMDEMFDERERGE